MADILSQLLDYLQANQTDPWTYLLVFFLFSVAAAVFLPIPIEIGLIWNPSVFFPLKAVVLGLGKAVGAVAVFYIPSNIGALAKRLGVWHAAPSASPAPPKWGWLRWLSRKSEVFARKYGVIAMYIIMSIPGMIDTVPLYVFSIVNKERTLIPLRDFALANFLAGINRAFIIFALLEILGIRFF